MADKKDKRCKRLTKEERKALGLGEQPPLIYSEDRYPRLRRPDTVGGPHTSDDERY